jgi:hypothetical protein
MPEKPTQEVVDRMHRWFAVECNNGAWDLTAKAERTASENREMLYMAYGAAYHWSKVGTPLHDARADVLVCHVHAMLGHADLAMQYARRTLAFCENNACEDWDLAFAHAEMSHAAWAKGDADLHREHYELAVKAGEAIKEAEDRKFFMEEFARFPRM